MDRSKLDQQLDRRLEKIDIMNSIRSNRKPITEYDRYSFTDKVPYEDAVVDATVLVCRERINDNFRDIHCEGFGPWILFIINDIDSGDPEANLCPGAVVMARWNNTRKIYKKYIYKEDPQPYDDEVLAMSTFMRISELEIVKK